MGTASEEATSRHATAPTGGRSVGPTGGGRVGGRRLAAAPVHAGRRCGDVAAYASRAVGTQTTSPGQMRSGLVIWGLAAVSASRSTPKRCAMAKSVSPGWTT